MIYNEFEPSGGPKVDKDRVQTKQKIIKNQTHLEKQQNGTLKDLTPLIGKHLFGPRGPWETNNFNKKSTLQAQ